MGPDPHHQLGLFGEDDVFGDMHLVSAHTRQLEDGSEVFVGEHMRWNRGQQPARAPAPRSRPVIIGQPGLFEAIEVGAEDDPEDGRR